MKDLCSGRPIVYISCAQHHSTSHAKGGVVTPPRRPAHVEDATITLKDADAHVLTYEQLFPLMID